jgi:hypothetical protein
LSERHIDKINWRFLARNPSAVDLLRRHPEKIDWYMLTYNPSLFTYDYVAMKNSTSLFHEELIQKVLHPRRLIKYLEEYDYDAMKKATSLFHEELIQKVLHPRRLMKYLEQYNYDIASEEYYSAF